MCLKTYDSLKNIFTNKYKNNKNIYSTSTKIYNSLINKEYINKDNNGNILKIYNINNLLEKCKIDYQIYSWFSLDNSISSSIHYDTTDNILLVLDGQKKVYLSPPQNIINMYITANVDCWKNI